MRTSDFYNFCRVHESLRVTPGMALGVTSSTDNDFVRIEKWVSDQGDVSPIFKSSDKVRNPA